MKKLVLTILALCALGAALAGPASARPWYSNNWTSPSKNIRCTYNPYQDSLTCATVTPRRAAITLWPSGSTSRSRKLPSGRGPSLPYGTYWASYVLGGDIRCDSYTSGLECYNSGGGFHISREAVYGW